MHKENDTNYFTNCNDVNIIDNLRNVSNVRYLHT
jgi:hypothetical protein